MIPQNSLSPRDALQLRLVAGRIVHNDNYSIEAATAAICGRCHDPRAVLRQLPDMVLEMSRESAALFFKREAANESIA